jgi:hypothetical protein
VPTKVKMLILKPKILFKILESKKNLKRHQSSRILSKFNKKMMKLNSKEQIRTNLIKIILNIHQITL